MDGAKIVYGDKTYTAEDILDCQFYFGNSVIADNLSIDTFDAEVFAPEDIPYQYIWTIDNRQIAAKDGAVWVYETGKDLSNYTYGDPIFLYHDDQLIGKFFVESITRTGAYTYAISAVSAVGLMANYQFDGGMYNGSPTSVASLLETMLTGVPITYTIDPALESVWVKGWLPTNSVLECVKQLLFESGAAVMKQADGDVVFKFNQPEVATPIDPDKVYIGGKVDYLTKATQVTVTEHNYYASASAQEECLFDNTESEVTANNDRIQFSKPYQTATFRAEDENGNDITATAIVTRHVNYVVVTGFCKVFAKPYLDAQRYLTESTGISSAPNELKVEDATLVSDINSLNTLRRLVNYYKNADEIKYSFVGDDRVKPGLLVNVPDPNDYIDTTGFIKDAEGTVSGIIKVDTTLVKGWVPKYLGNDYNDYIIIDKSTLGGLSGTWTVPASLRGKNAYVVYFGGAQGGTGGNNGQDGTICGRGSTFVGFDNRGYRFMEGIAGDPGTGGAGGAGGLGGNRPPTYGAEKLVLENTYSITLGAGGNGGSAQVEGSLGGLTSFNGHTSDTFELTGDYINIVDGSVYCRQGDSGGNGYAGGNGGSASKNIKVAGNNPGQQAVNGGNPTNGTSINSFTPQYPDWVEIVYNAGGGGAGGGSYNQLGGNAGLCDAEAAEIEHPRDPTLIYYSVKGGDGGNGASPTYIPPQTTLGQGGTGGAGGGGGGGGGASAGIQAPYGRQAVGGTGGTGGTAGKGSDGFIVCYFNNE